MQTRKKPAVYFKTFFEAYLVIVKTTSCKNFISYDFYAYVYKKYRLQKRNESYIALFLHTYDNEDDDDDDFKRVMAKT